MTKRRRDATQAREPRSRRNKATDFDSLLPSLHVGNTRPLKNVQLTPKNESQKRYIGMIDANDLVFGLGPAGTGKTFVAAWKAAEAFERGDVERIVVTRPVVEAGESLGFLPGDMGEKIDPYFVPVREALERKLGKGKVEYLVKGEQIVFVPLAFMRGRTFNDAFVIADEMQNSTPAQMKMLLTRAGERTRLLVNGDLLQSDIPGPNGLHDAVHRFRGKPSVGVMTFRREDVVRSGLAALAVDAYEGEDRREQEDLLHELPSFITGKVHDNDRDA